MLALRQIRAGVDVTAWLSEIPEGSDAYQTALSVWIAAEKTIERDEGNPVNVMMPLRDGDTR